MKLITKLQRPEAIRISSSARPVQCSTVCRVPLTRILPHPARWVVQALCERNAWRRDVVAAWPVVFMVMVSHRGDLLEFTWVTFICGRRAHAHSAAFFGSPKGQRRLDTGSQFFNVFPKATAFPSLGGPEERSYSKRRVMSKTWRLRCLLCGITFTYIHFLCVYTNTQRPVRTWTFLWTHKGACQNAIHRKGELLAGKKLRCLWWF